MSRNLEAFHLPDILVNLLSLYQKDGNDILSELGTLDKDTKYSFLRVFLPKYVFKEMRLDVLEILKDEIKTLLSQWPLGENLPPAASDDILSKEKDLLKLCRIAKYSSDDEHRAFAAEVMDSASLDYLLTVIKKRIPPPDPVIIANAFFDKRTEIFTHLFADLVNPYTPTFDEKDLLSRSLEIINNLESAKQKTVLMYSPKISAALLHRAITQSRASYTIRKALKQMTIDHSLERFLAILIQLEASFIFEVLNQAPNDYFNDYFIEIIKYMITKGAMDALGELIKIPGNEKLWMHAIYKEMQGNPTAGSKDFLFEKYCAVVAEERTVSKADIYLEVLDGLNKHNLDSGDEDEVVAKNFAWYLQLNADKYSDDPGFQVEVFRRSIQYFSDAIAPEEIQNPSYELILSIIKILGQEDLPAQKSLGALTRVFSAYEGILFNAVLARLCLPVYDIPDDIRLKAAERLVCLHPGIEDMPGLFEHEKIPSVDSGMPKAQRLLAVSFSDVLDALFMPIKKAIEGFIAKPKASTGFWGLSSRSVNELEPQLLLMQENFNNPKDGAIEAKLTAFMKAYEKLVEKDLIDAKSSSYLEKLMPLFSFMVKIMQYKSPSLSFSQSVGLFSSSAFNPVYAGPGPAREEEAVAVSQDSYHSP